MYMICNVYVLQLQAKKEKKGEKNPQVIKTKLVSKTHTNSANKPETIGDDV